MPESHSHFSHKDQPYPWLYQDVQFTEEQVIENLLQDFNFFKELEENVSRNAQTFIDYIRTDQKKLRFQNLMHTYELSSEEGLALLSLSESLLRIPDRETAYKLIYDKTNRLSKQLDRPEPLSFLEKVGKLGIHLSNWFLDQKHNENQSFLKPFRRLFGGVSEPVIYRTFLYFVKKLGHQFVMGETIEKALALTKIDPHNGYRHSFDMLGEAALTAEDADRYFESYTYALHKMSLYANGKDLFEAPSLSIKLSALHPRYEFLKKERVLKELVPKVEALAVLAKQKGIALTLDAEEADRLTLSLEIIQKVASLPALQDWDGLGLAVQAYQKRCLGVLDFLVNESEKTGRRFCVRLVKGAYWDSEIKRAQEKGLSYYPVFTRKNTTDISYLVAAHKLLNNDKAFYPQFATHNAYTVASILEMAGERDFEFQKLYGMGDELYDYILKNHQRPCRVYAPIGVHQDLLPYLVRRLLENGANTSFVNLAAKNELDLQKLTENPQSLLEKEKSRVHSLIPLPQKLYGNARQNSKSKDLADPHELELLAKAFEQVEASFPLSVHSLTSKKILKREETFSKFSPNSTNLAIAVVEKITEQDVDNIMNEAMKGFDHFKKTSAETRALLLEKTADLFEKHMNRFMALCVYEGGKTLQDALSEVREAIDFCRYYAEQGRKLLKSQTLNGPTGENNVLTLYPRGVFVCISPWNFPLAIFIGQITAALMAGNAVVAKPAEQTPLIAYEAIKLMHEAGFSKDVLQLVLGQGSTVGQALINHPFVAGVAFTGSTAVVKHMAQIFALKEGPIVPFIAETGG
jgi:RHH-type transcriptional regulator, proline utilization regulon repressor / proline dehydrogenase / delta 1-pyrroline-5-carboxylate dehydrogenase